MLDRDAAIIPQQIVRYDDKVKYLQVELDTIFKEVNESGFNFKKACKYYRSETCNKYFLHDKVYHKADIKRLHTDSGEEVTMDSQILKESHSFNSKLYCKQSDNDALNPGLIHKFLKHVPGDRLSIQHHTLLSKDISLNELHSALKAMKLGVI